MLKSIKHSIASRKYTITCYQTLEEVLWLLRLDQPTKMTKIVIKLAKIASFIKKQIDKKKLKTIPLPLKTMQPHIIKTLSRFSEP